MGTQINSTDSAFIQNSNRSTVRTSAGTIYQILNVVVGGSTSYIEVWKSSDGTSWAEQDHAHAPNSGAVYSGATGAIDSAGIIHIVYRNEASMTPTMRYVQFNTATDLFQNDAQITTLSAAEHGACGVAVDSNDKPHAFWTESITNMGTSYRTLQYSNRISGSWATKVEVYGQASTKAVDFGPSMLIDNNNKPQLAFVVSTDSKIRAAIGNANNATSFTLSDCEASTDVLQVPVSIALDSSNNTWISYCRSATNDFLYLVKHNAADAWTTWQTPVTDSKPVETGASHGGEGPVQVIAINGTTIYAIYQARANGNIVYQTYTGSWSSVTTLESVDADRVNCKWSQYFNNGGTTQIDYCYTASVVDTTASWNKIVLAGGGGLTQSPSDSINNLADARQLGYGNLHADSVANLSDAAQVAIGYPLSLSDSVNNLADGAVKVIGIITTATDSLDALTDALVKLLSYELALADSEAANWADAHQLLLAQFLALSDSYSLTDTTVIRLEQREQFGDSFTLSDAVELQLGTTLTLTDDSFNLADSSTQVEGQLKTFTDSLTTPTDSLALGYGLLITDTAATLTDALDLRGEGLLLATDALTLTDTVVVELGYQISFTDSLSLTDSYTQQATGLLTFSDSFSITDLLSLGYGLTLADDSFNLADSYAQTRHEVTNAVELELDDAISLTDSFALGYGLLTTDALSFTDSHVEVIGQLITFSDSLSLTDSASLRMAHIIPLEDSYIITDSESLTLGYEKSASDALNLTDGESHRLGQLLEFSDAITLTDSYAQFLAQLLAFSDSITITDAYAAILHYLLTASDDINTFVDLLVTDAPQAPNIQVGVTDALATFSDEVTLRLSYQLATSDSFTLTDNAQLALGYLATLGDVLSLTDAESATLGYLQPLADSFALTDSARTGLGYEIASADVLTFDDSVANGLGYQLDATDALLLNDSLQLAFGYFTQLNDSFNLTDSETALLGQRLPLSDSFLLSDSVQMQLGYEVALSDVVVLSDFAVLNLSHSISLSDNVALLADSASISLGWTVIIVDNAQLLTDEASFFSAGFLRLSDTLALTDSLTTSGETFLPLADSLLLTDDVDVDLRGPDLDESLSDTFTITDAFALTLGDELRLQLVLTDTITLSDHYFALRRPYTPSIRRHIVVPSRARTAKVTSERVVVVPPSDRTTKVP